MDADAMDGLLQRTCAERNYVRLRELLNALTHHTERGDRIDAFQRVLADEDLAGEDLSVHPQVHRFDGPLPDRVLASQLRRIADGLTGETSPDAGSFGARPGPRRAPAEPPPGYDDHAPDPAQPVVGIGAVCDYRSGGEGDDRSVSFSVGEFVVLADGRRILLHFERGYTSSGVIGGNSGPEWDGITRGDIRNNVLMVVLPDDDDTGEDHPWEWLAELARRKGVATTAEELAQLEYDVVLTDRVEQWLAGTR